jgi:hypothetical protein
MSDTVPDNRKQTSVQFIAGNFYHQFENNHSVTDIKN